MLIEGAKNAYKVERRLAESKNYRLYLAHKADTRDRCLLQVARNLQANGGLSRAKFVLDELAETSRHYDEIYSRQNKGKHLHYDRLYPRVDESFLLASQGGRRVNVLSFTDVENVSMLIPLSNLRLKDRVILDLRSGAWVMGRLVKLLDYIHPLGIALRSLGPRNILLETSQHYAIVLDWTEALVFQQEVSSEAATADISRAAETVLEACGVPDQGSLPFMLQDGEDVYVAMMRDFAGGKIANADEAHVRFYDTCHRALGTGFHPFTTRPL